jgi:membrane protein YqaA with SNARE-associated domain
MSELLTYGGLFAVSMIAATLLPLQSEAVLAGLLLAAREARGRWCSSRASATSRAR